MDIHLKEFNYFNFGFSYPSFMEVVEVLLNPLPYYQLIKFIINGQEVNFLMAFSYVVKLNQIYYLQH